MGVAETVKHVAFPVVDADSVADVDDASLDGCWALLADVDGGIRTLSDHFYAGCFVDGPLADELAVGGEDLDAVALAVADDYEVVVEDSKVMGKIEFAVVGAGFTPRHNVDTFGVEAVNAGVAVAIRDEDVAGCRVDGGIGGTVEHLSALAGNFFTGADSHKVFAGGGVFVDLVPDIVHEPKVVFVVAGDPMRSHEPAVPELHAVAIGVFGDADRALRVVIAPHVDQITLGVEDEDGNVASIEYVDVIFGVDRYSGGFSEPYSVGDFGPSRYGLVVGDVVG